MVGALWGLDAVGLSGIVWAWLFPARLVLDSANERRSLAPLFWLMLVWIPVGFAGVNALLHADKWLVAALLANLFHGIGTAAGLLYIVLHQRWGRPSAGGTG